MHSFQCLILISSDSDYERPVKSNKGPSTSTAKRSGVLRRHVPVTKSTPQKVPVRKLRGQIRGWPKTG